MTPVGGAIRGGTAGLVWSAAFMVTSAAISRAAPATRSIPGIGNLFAFFAPTTGQPGRWLSLVAAAGLAGGIVGLVGHRLRIDPWRRTAALWVVSYPAVGFGLTTVAWLPDIASRWRFMPVSDLALAPLVLPLMGTLLALLSVVFTPLLALPLMAAAVTVETWTRPAEFEQSPLARPYMQVGLVASLLAITVAALGYLWASWQAIPGGSWLVP